MPQDINLLNAIYSGVPAVVLPKNGGGTATFTDVTDTTAAAADVASGKYFYTAAGVRTAGTSSGGGGASNMVTGSFTAPDTTSSVTTDITIPYTGTGYPIAALIYVKDGVYNSDNTEWYSKIQRYAMGVIALVKVTPESAPTYATSGTNNAATVVNMYKGSTSSATSYSGTRTPSANIYSSDKATNTSSLSARFNGNTTLSIYTSATTYGFMPNIEYRYVILYSE